MRSINALSLAPDVNDWLANSRHPRILHVFDRVCNLINERREVLSIVMQHIGNGPFNLVLEDDILFSEHFGLHAKRLVSNSPNHLNLGDLTINTHHATLWSPRPDWEKLHARRDLIIGGLKSCLSAWKSAEADSITTFNPKLPITNYPSPILQFSNSLISSIATANIQSSKISASKLAGLGIGLTPAGDDFILGALLAAWIIHPPEIARVLAEEIANTAAPLTTSLSAAWLKSAGRGEAGILWHNFFDALISVDRTASPLGIGNPTYMMAIQGALDKILAMGETSGADALAGFLNLFACWMESRGDPSWSVEKPYQDGRVAPALYDK